MGWNTGFSQVPDTNKGCSLLMVLKHNVWLGICSVVRLDMDILIEISVFGLEGAKKSTQKPQLTLFFFILHNWLLKKLRFCEWHDILRCGIFHMAQNIKTLKLDKIKHFFVETHAVYTKFVYFQFNHFPKSKIDFKSRFEMKISIFLF